VDETKIERYMIDLMLTYREISENIWMIEDENHSLNGVVVAYSDPLVIIRVAVMPVPQENKLELFTKLLELNANDVVHGAYALDTNDIILIDTLEYDSMDLQDFRASLDAISLALTQHYPVLSKYRSNS
jgi:hypothetical protein